MVHTLRLDNYFPTPRKLVLGTNSSFGTESIKIERGAGWDGLNLTATWHIPGREEPLRVALLDGDAMDVPPEVTKEARDGVLVLAGLAEGVQRASCNVEYLILEQAGVYGSAGGGRGQGTRRGSAGCQCCGAGSGRGRSGGCCQGRAVCGGRACCPTGCRGCPGQSYCSTAGGGECGCCRGGQ